MTDPMEMARALAVRSLSATEGRKMTTTDMLKPRAGVNGATIILRSGAYFDFLKPDPETISINDIGWALAYTCRFGGQSLHFYSVAQHSVLVSQIVPPELAMAGLLHDASEAYVGDVVKPLKQLLPDFEAVEDRVERAVADRFNLPFPMPYEIKHADLRLLRTEQRDLTSGNKHNWSGLDKYEPLAERINPLPANDAAKLFFDRFDELAFS